LTVRINDIISDIVLIEVDVDGKAAQSTHEEEKVSGDRGELIDNSYCLGASGILLLCLNNESLRITRITSNLKPLSFEIWLNHFSIEIEILLNSIRRWSGMLMEQYPRSHCKRVTTKDDTIAITDQYAHVFLSTASTMPEANHDIQIIRDIIKEASVPFLIPRDKVTI
jgi:hypothetical protein